MQMCLVTEERSKDKYRDSSIEANIVRATDAKKKLKLRHNKSIIALIVS